MKYIFQLFDSLVASIIGIARKWRERDAPIWNERFFTYLHSLHAKAAPTTTIMQTSGGFKYIRPWWFAQLQDASLI
jgi:hypothetical protein